MRTPKELNRSLYEIRTDAINGIYDLLKGKKSYAFKEGISISIEDDEGSYLQDIYFVKSTDEVLYFTECKGDSYEEGYSFGEMSTETIVNLYSHLNYELN